MENKKVKFALRISPETQEQIKEWSVRDNCQSQNEFVDKAVKFYIGYVASRDVSEFLPRTLVSSIRGTLDDSENRVARLLFKLAVELSMTMHVVASDRGIGESDLAKLRAKCVADVKKSIGTISFDEAVKYQSGY
jgi:DNA-directed RNA polymerase specialized sigma subunit